MESNWSISAVVSLPDVLSSVLEQALHLLISRWDVVTMNDDLENALNALGIDIKNVMVTENADIACEEQSDVRKIIEKRLKCNLCDESFDHTSEDVKTKVAIHVGECHLEKEAQDEQLKLFPAQKCESCGQKFHRKEARKLHTITKHPWQNLKSNIDNIFKHDKIEVGEKNRKQEEQLKRSPITHNSSSVGTPKVDCIESVKESVLKKAQCTMCDKKWKKDGVTNISALRASIKNHICKKHFEADMALLLTDNFKGSSCQRCKSIIVTEADQKKHLQNNHGIFDDVVKPMLEDILGSTKNKRKRKARKATSTRKILKSSERNRVDDHERMLGSPHAKKSCSEPQTLEETSAFKELQSCIEYSDSDDGDSDYEDLNEIQSNIDYSDSSDED